MVSAGGASNEKPDVRDRIPQARGSASQLARGHWENAKTSRPHGRPRARQRVQLLQGRGSQLADFPLEEVAYLDDRGS